MTVSGMDGVSAGAVTRIQNEGTDLAFRRSLNFVGDGIVAAVNGNAIDVTVAAGTEVGYVGIPINSQSGNYTCVIGDAGKCIYHPTTDDNARTFTIPANSSVAYPVGTAITFVNDKNTLTIAMTTDTMVLAGGVLTGSRTMATTSSATALKVTSTRWVISGAGIT